MFKVQDSPCATCIYRADSPLDVAALEAQVADPYGGFRAHRVCHHSDDVCCNGFWARHKDEFPLGQVAQRLGMVEFVAVDTLRARRAAAPHPLPGLYGGHSPEEHTMSTPKAIAVPRGCGTRQQGGLYLEVGLGPGGMPLEHFLIDPPQPVDTDKMGIAPVGVKLVKEPDRDVWHVFDWVGSKHYPNVADFLEEVRRFGVSRRVSQGTDFSKITDESRLILLHSHAVIENHSLYYRARRVRSTASKDARPMVPAHGGNPDAKVWWCPKRRRDHVDPDKPTPCASLLWEDVEGGEAYTAGEPGPGGLYDRWTVRKLPSFEYVALAPPEGLKPKRRVGMFASFPLHRIVAVRDRHGDKHEVAAERARKSKLPVEVEDE